MTDPVAPAPARGNPFAVPSIVLAIVVILLTLMSRAVSTLAPLLTSTWHLSITGVYAFIGGLGGLVVVLAIATAILEIVGVTRPGRPHGLVAAALGVGVTAAATYLLNLLSSTLAVAALTPR